MVNIDPVILALSEKIRKEFKISRALANKVVEIAENYRDLEKLILKEKLKQIEGEYEEK
tara:strand:+ start:52 stop:228 length:177 start_codon:yes stop_codon:yes gene_type:complete